MTLPETWLSQLTSRHLLERMPEQYRAWLRVGMWASLAGYGLVLIAHLLTRGVGDLWRLREPYVLFVVLIACWLERKERLQAAALLTISAVWLEGHLTYALVGAKASSAALFPTLVLGTALFVGMRFATPLALSTVITIPGAVLLSKLRSGKPWELNDAVWLIILVCSTCAAAAMLSLFLQAFGMAIVKADRHAARARDLIDGAPDAILAINQRGVIEDCNPAAERLLGLSAADLLGFSFSSLDLREVGGAGTLPDFDTLRGTPREYLIENRNLSVEGLLRTVTRADGSRGSLIVLRDITERKRAERRAKELQYQLQHSQKLEAIGRLAGGVAHDFNNLLTAVGGYGDLLARHPDRLVQAVAEELTTARARGTGLTRQLLAFARKEFAEPRGIDLCSIISGMDRLLQQLCGEKISLVLNKQPTLIHADPGQLQQVILNLVLNARDAMATGGTLTLSCAVDPDSGRAELQVSDTGCGMSERTLERLFEPFFTTKPRGQGTGLGLSTVHGIIEASGGNIRVQSAVNRGTTFTLSWPVYGGAEAPVEALTPAEHPLTKQRRGRVLLTEDDPQSRNFLVQLLNAAGFTVNVANDGEQALHKYVELRTLGSLPDVLLSDVRMPKMTGVELATRLRLLDPSLPVLFISGYLEETLEASQFQRSQDLLLKPFTAEALLDRLDRKVRKRTSSDVLPGATPPSVGLTPEPKPAAEA